jgi:hypothetical protein
VPGVTRVVRCADERCRRVLWEGSDSIPSEILPEGPGPQPWPCTDCGSRSRRIELFVSDEVTISEGVKLAVGGGSRHSPSHKFTREVTRQERVGLDGRPVERIMDIARDHDPPYKWHRVVVAATEEVVKNELINSATGETYDFRDPRVQAPAWFPYVDPRAS